MVTLCYGALEIVGLLLLLLLLPACDRQTDTPPMAKWRCCIAERGKMLRSITILVRLYEYL